MTRCKPHQKFNCVVCDPSALRRSSQVNADGGAGQVGINTEGHLAMGIGSGLSLDLQDGSLGVQVSPGFSVDTSPSTPDPSPSYDSPSDSGSW